MTFPTDDIYLGPATFGTRKGHEGIIWHTTEGGGPSRAAAVSTANWQKSNPGSYNFIIYDAGSTGAKGGALLTVPYLEASGGVNPASSAWEPEEWMRALLTPAAFADPNAYLMNVAFSGKAADLAAGSYPANMIDTAARLTIWFEDGFGKNNATMCAHEDWQSNRSDPGPGVIARIIQRVNELRGTVDYKALYEAEVIKSAELTKRVRSLRAAVKKRDAYIEAYPG